MFKTFAIEAIVMALAASDMVNAIKIQGAETLAKAADDMNLANESLAETKINGKALKTCNTRTFTGAMRPWSQKQHCLDNYKARNEYVFSDDCEGEEDQNVTYCEEDGTLRVGYDSGSGLCIQQYSSGQWIVTENCNSYGDVLKQQWDIIHQEDAYGSDDSNRVDQRLYVFRNRATNTCLGVNSSNWFQLESCNTSKTSQKMGIPTRSILFSGRMMHMGHNKCLYQNGTGSWEYIKLVDCEDDDLKNDMKLFWTYYSDGSIENMGSHKCVGPYSSSDIYDEWAITDNCDYTKTDERFYASVVTDKVVQLVSKVDQSQCLIVQQNDYYAEVDTCYAGDYSQFRFLGENEIGGTQIVWEEIHCTQTGELKGAFNSKIETTKEYSTTFSASVGVAVATEVDLGVAKVKQEVSVTVGTAITNAYSNSSNEQISINFNCSMYEDKSPFDQKKGGCAYRLRSITDVGNGSDEFNWASPIVKCLPFGKSEPDCPAFMYPVYSGSSFECHDMADYKA